MEWIRFRDKVPGLNEPIFIYRPQKGIMNFFKPKDDIRKGYISRIEENPKGFWYAIKGYGYGSNSTEWIDQKELFNMVWMEIPEPPKTH